MDPALGRGSVRQQVNHAFRWVVKRQLSSLFLPASDLGTHQGFDRLVWTLYDGGYIPLTARGI